VFTLGFLPTLGLHAYLLGFILASMLGLKNCIGILAGIKSQARVCLISVIDLRALILHYASFMLLHNLEN
jgi:hypothetical protein